jgi:hypothetical protein
MFANDSNISDSTPKVEHITIYQSTANETKFIAGLQIYFIEIRY